MRQRQEGLGFWLNREPATTSIMLRVGARVGSWLKMPAVTATVAGFLPVLEANVAAGQVTLEIPGIKDGLWHVKTSVDSPTAGTSLKDASDTTPIPNPAENLPVVKTVDFSPFEAITTVNEWHLLRRPVAKSGMPPGLEKSARARNIPILKNAVRVIGGAGFLMSLESFPRVMTSDLRSHPHVRFSLDLRGISDRRLDDLCREAELVKSWEHGQAEVVAVFARIPVELLSRVQFLQERRQLVYTLHGTTKMAKTRIHDLIAVRDRKSGNIHLVPERMRYAITGLSPSVQGSL
jgi:hypothetical protein